MHLNVIFQNHSAFSLFRVCLTNALSFYERKIIMSSIFMPTKVLIDDAVIENNQSAWLLGQSALLITGRSSAKLSGAEADVIACLEANNIQYSIFNQVENDPTVETVWQQRNMPERLAQILLLVLVVVVH